MLEITEQIRLAERVFFEDNPIPFKHISGADKKLLEEYYGTESAPKFTSSFRQSLYKIFFTFKLSKAKTSERVFQSIKLKRLLAVADILLGLGSRKSAVMIYKKCISLALANNINWAVMHCSRKLYVHFGTYKSNLKEMNKYLKIFESSRIKYNAEVECEKAFAFLALHFNKKKEHSQKIKEQVAEKYTEFNKVSIQDRSVNFNRYFRSISTMYFEIKNDIDELVSYLIREINRLENSEVDLPNDIDITIKYLCHYTLRVERFDLFDLYYKKGIVKTKNSTFSWFRLQELYSLRLLRKSNYKEGQKLLLELTQVKAFNSINIFVQNRIKLKLLYSTLYCLLANIDYDENAKILRRHQSYIHSMPEFQMDKKAMNISLIIFQLIYSIWKKEYEMLDIRFEAVDKYLRRYTKSSPLFRSHSFIKILLTIKRYNFVTKGAERVYKKYENQLRSLAYKLSPHPGEIEIIYYENLLEAINSYLSYDRQSETA